MIVASVWANSLCKRVFDVVFVISLAALWIPVCVLVAVAVRIALGAPVFFTQERPGRNGKIFKLIKFRTMRTGDADDAARMTRFGKILRATSLDELPELWNILRGDMSLIGPRPLLVRYLPRYTAEQSRRHDVRPGLTGWAQVNGRNLLSWEARFEHDVWYVEHATFWLDLRIIFLTFLNLFRRTGISARGESTMREFTGTHNE